MNAKSDIHRQNLGKLFSPHSVAIVGTNSVKGSVPYDILHNTIESGYTGKVYPVSPGEKIIDQIKTYKYVIDIEEPVDLAILVFPAAVIHMALEQCGQKGIKAVIIISAGFKEIGGAGIDREKQIQDIANHYNISIVGPNCLGVINTDPLIQLNASFARAMPEQGSIAFLSQSGALCTAVLDYARSRHIGFSKFISFGNKADVTEMDLLLYLMHDDQTKVILLYLEEITDGRGLMEAAIKVKEESGKPVLMIKAGRTTEGAAAAASHTGSLAGSDTICDAALRQAGIIRCHDMVELFDRAVAFAYQPAPKGDKVAIITNAGGPGVLATDAVIDQGLRLASFSEQTAKLLKRHLPSTANRSNPIDVIGDARTDRYNAAMKATFEDEDVNAVFVILTPQSMTDIDLIAKEVVQVSAGYSKPVYTSFMGEADVRSGIEILNQHGIPNYRIPESMADALKYVYQFQNQNHEETRRASDDSISVNAKGIIDMVMREGRNSLTETEGMELLKAYGFPTLSHQLIHSADEAIKAFEAFEGPVVMKVLSADIWHKTDVGGIQLNINTPEAAGTAYNQIMESVKRNIPEAQVEGILMLPMVEGGEEVILGMKRDASFGPVILFGMGGVLVELYQDVSFRVAPITEQQAGEMMQEVTGTKLLQGYRGRDRLPVEAVKKNLVQLSQLVMQLDEIEEMDINPLIVTRQGCYVVDVKIKLNL